MSRHLGTGRPTTGMPAAASWPQRLAHATFSVDASIRAKPLAVGAMIVLARCKMQLADWREGQRGGRRSMAEGKSQGPNRTPRETPRSDLALHNLNHTTTAQPHNHATKRSHAANRGRHLIRAAQSVADQLSPPTHEPGTRPHPPLPFTPFSPIPLICTPLCKPASAPPRRPKSLKLLRR